MVLPVMFFLRAHAILLPNRSVTQAPLANCPQTRSPYAYGESPYAYGE